MNARLPLLDLVGLAAVVAVSLCVIVRLHLRQLAELPVSGPVPEELRYYDEGRLLAWWLHVD